MAALSRVLADGGDVPYPLLVNGAFATDLSRQHVPVSDDPDDYNANLIRRAARLVCSQLIPMIRQQGVEAVLRLFERGSGGDHAGAAALLHRAITDELADMPLIPTETRQRPHARARWCCQAHSSTAKANSSGAR